MRRNDLSSAQEHLFAFSLSIKASVLISLVTRPNKKTIFCRSSGCIDCGQSKGSPMASALLVVELGDSSRARLTRIDGGVHMRTNCVRTSPMVVSMGPYG